MKIQRIQISRSKTTNFCATNKRDGEHYQFVNSQQINNYNLSINAQFPIIDIQPINKGLSRLFKGIINIFIRN